jgi:hypothetical protein
LWTAYFVTTSRIRLYSSEGDLKARFRMGMLKKRSSAWARQRRAGAHYPPRSLFHRSLQQVVGRSSCPVWRVPALHWRSVLCGSVSARDSSAPPSALPQLATRNSQLERAITHFHPHPSSLVLLTTSTWLQKLILAKASPLNPYVARL